MKCQTLSIWLSVMSQIRHCCHNLSSDLFVMESTPSNEDDLTPHNSYLAHDDSYFSSEQYCVTERACSEQWGLSSVVESERAYLSWLTDGDYSSTSYQSQGGVMVCGRNSLLRLTVSTSHLTPTQLVKQYHRPYRNYFISFIWDSTWVNCKQTFVDAFWKILHLANLLPTDNKLLFVHIFQ